MTQLSDFIWECRDYLYTNQALEGNLLASSMGATDQTLTTQFPVGTMAVRGCIIAIELELMRCWSTVGNVVTVERGVMGSTAASHSGESDPDTYNDPGYIEVMPKFSQFQVMRAINNELDELASPWNGIYAIQDLELTYNPAISGYDMT